MPDRDALLALTKHERRVLSFLDQRGPTHRRDVVWELAHPESKIGFARDHGRHLGGGGSNNGEPMIMARWCRRLGKAGLVRERYDDDGFYRSHEITREGAAALRALAGEGSRPLE